MKITEKDVESYAEQRDVQLYDWQKTLIWDRDVKKWCFLNWRKTGKTTGVEFRTAVRLCNDNIQGIGLSGGVCITSKTLDEARWMLNSILATLSAHGWEFSKERSRMSEDKMIAYATSEKIIMPNLNRVIVK